MCVHIQSEKSMAVLLTKIFKKWQQEHFQRVLQTLALLYARRCMGVDPQKK